MIYRIRKENKTLKGIVRLTPSKSISNRLLIIQSLCLGKIQVNNLASANDTMLLRSLLKSASGTLDAEDAGTTFRFLTAYLTQKKGTWLLTGDERMKQRPVGVLVNALRLLGAEISFTEKENFPPLKITGKKLTGGEIEIDGSISSQFISALLLIAPTLEAGLTLNLTGEISSRTYIEMTLKLMAEFGIQFTWKGNSISIRHQQYRPKEISVESDWSAASYWFEMAALADDVDLTLIGLQHDSIQGDSVISEMMKSFGVETVFNEGGLRLTKKPGVKLPEKFSYNFQSCPDLAQTMALTCATLRVDSEFKGVQSLRIKETDRLNALKTELKKIGTESQISDSEFQISNLNFPRTPNFRFQTYNDHRMAMSLAPLALVFGEVEIENPDVVKKSYPEFWEDLKSVGFEINEI